MFCACNHFYLRCLCVTCWCMCVCVCVGGVFVFCLFVGGGERGADLFCGLFCNQLSPIKKLAPSCIKLVMLLL